LIDRPSEDSEVIYLENFMRIRNLTIATAAALFLTGALFGETLYVVSPAAKLLKEPKMSASGPALKPGTQVNSSGQQGMFVQVQTPMGSGYVSKLFVSKYAPTGKVDTTKIKLNQQVATRDKASAYSETAAARGFSTGTDERFDNPEAFDFAEVDWIEKQKPDQKQVDIFLRQGKLHKFGS
tara:strand:+ start:17739 stop:18281 length:543 start_codon:yes stop_codon:yes gene_type:complete